MFNSTLVNDVMNEKQDPFVIKCWANNKISSTVILSIPRQLAIKYNIKPHSNLLAIDTNEGIHLKRIKKELID
jgi:hypothetical protein